MPYLSQGIGSISAYSFPGFFCCASVYFSILFLFFFQYERNYIALQKKTPKMHCSGLSLAATIKTATQFKIHHNSRNSKTDKAFKLCEHTFKRISVSKLRQRNLTVEGEFGFQWCISISGKCQEKRMLRFEISSVFVQIYVLNLIQLKVYNLRKNFSFCPIIKTMDEITPNNFFYMSC